MQSRSELREKIMIILYQISIYEKNNIVYNVDNVISENYELDNEFVKEIVYGVITHNNEIIDIANKFLGNWPMDRLDKIGAAILKISIYEIKYTDTPAIVAINEALELSKKYSDDSVRKIINAVLDKVMNEYGE